LFGVGLCLGVNVGVMLALAATSVEKRAWGALGLTAATLAFVAALAVMIWRSTKS
jgi:hypothetical protein